MNINLQSHDFEPIRESMIHVESCNRSMNLVSSDCILPIVKVTKVTTLFDKALTFNSARNNQGMDILEKI